MNCTEPVGTAPVVATTVAISCVCGGVFAVRVATSTVAVGIACTTWLKLAEMLELFAESPP